MHFISLRTSHIFQVQIAISTFVLVFLANKNSCVAASEIKFVPGTRFQETQYAIRSWFITHTDSNSGDKPDRFVENNKWERSLIDHNSITPRSFLDQIQWSINDQKWSLHNCAIIFLQWAIMIAHFGDRRLIDHRSNMPFSRGRSHIPTSTRLEDKVIFVQAQG